MELANLAVPTLAEAIDQAHKGIQRVRRTPHLAYSSLRHAGLSVSDPQPGTKGTPSMASRHGL
jgi:hypothetical protein